MLMERIREVVALCPEIGEPAAARLAALPYQETEG
jgi:hypothetical protein